MTDKEDAHIKIWFQGELSEYELAAVRAWLRGKLGKKSKQEQIARRELARAVLAEEPLPKDVRLLLAQAFDPQGDGVGFVLKEARARGGPKVKAKNWEIAATIEESITSGRLMKQACHDAAKKFGVSERTAEKAYAECKDIIKALGPGAKIITD